MLEHVDKTKEILMRILLARHVHIVDPTPWRLEERIRYWMVVHGGVEVIKSRVSTLHLLVHIDSALLAFVCAVRPVFDSQLSQSAVNAIVSRCGASISTADWTAEVAVEFWRVQQALQYSIAVTQETRVPQSFGLVYSCRSRKGPAFANATVDDMSKVFDFAHYRHGCIESVLLVAFVASGHSSKDQLCRIAMKWGCIDGCVVVCKSRTHKEQSMLLVQGQKISASKEKRRWMEETWEKSTRAEGISLMRMQDSFRFSFVLFYCPIVVITAEYTLHGFFLLFVQ
jgi:hypothetical protein